MHVGKDGRRIEEPGSLGNLTAQQDARTAFHRVGDEALNLVHGFLIDHGAASGVRRAAIAQLDRAHLLHELAAELLVRAALNVEAIRGRAGFAAIAHLRDHGTRDRIGNVRVIQHDEGCIAAEFHRRVDDRIGGLAQEQSTDLSRTRERKFANAAIVQHGFDDWPRIFRGDHIHDPGRNACFEQDLRDGIRGERRFFRRLQDAGATGGEGRGDLASRHSRWEVPGCDQQRDADRLIQHDDAVGAAGRNADLAFETHGFFRIPAKEFSGVEHLAPGIGQRLAVLERDELRQPFAVRHHAIETLAQQLRALARRRRGPGLRSLLRGVDRLNALGHVRACYGRQCLSGRRVHDIDARLVARFLPVFADQKIGWNRMRRGCTGECIVVGGFHSGSGKRLRRRAAQLDRPNKLRP